MQINFPAITVCPRFNPSFEYLSKRYLGSIKYYKFERHTFLKYLYQKEEFLEEFKDEVKLGKTGYMKMLQKLKNGSIKPEELGTKL